MVEKAVGDLAGHVFCTVDGKFKTALCEDE